MRATPRDDKIPLFLMKLWKIVNDPALGSVIAWDDVSCGERVVPLSYFSSHSIESEREFRTIQTTITASNRRVSLVTA